MVRSCGVMVMAETCRHKAVAAFKVFFALRLRVSDYYSVNTFQVKFKEQHNTALSAVCGQHFWQCLVCSWCFCVCWMFGDAMLAVRWPSAIMNLPFQSSGSAVSPLPPPAIVTVLSLPIISWSEVRDVTVLSRSVYSLARGPQRSYVALSLVLLCFHGNRVRPRAGPKKTGPFLIPSVQLFIIALLW